MRLLPLLCSALGSGTVPLATLWGLLGEKHISDSGTPALVYPERRDAGVPHDGTGQKGRGAKVRGEGGRKGPEVALGFVASFHLPDFPLRFALDYEVVEEQ